MKKFFTETFKINKTLLILCASFMLLFPLLGKGHAVPFESTYSFTGGFHIHGHTPVPQRNGFDYYSTPVALDTSVAGKGVTISNVEVSSFGTNNGSAINWDWEIFLGPTSFGLPEGQFIKTLVDPISGYTRNAPTQVRFVIGSELDTQSYLFSGNYDFSTDTISADPYLAKLKAAFTSPMDLKDGLYAQMFFWTADNRNVNISFDDVKLVVQGDVTKPKRAKVAKPRQHRVPEPATLILFGTGLAGIFVTKRFRKQLL